ncbi:MAG: TRAP transporter small permease subunit [Burkholderiales bacterium]|nr:TRAP transporter small permease subunit [Burkholderiales bacterium]
MNPLLALARLIDRTNERIGRAVSWLVLIMALVSAGNAVSRKLFDLSSNAFLELQWTLFAAVFLLAAGYTLKRNEHVRIDVASARLSPRARAVLDIFGTLFFLFPLCLLILYHGLPFFLDSYRSGEVSNNPGGLILWPGKLLIPLGFALLFAQGLAEIIKRLAFLLGQAGEPTPPHSPEAEDMIMGEEGS